MKLASIDQTTYPNQFSIIIPALNEAAGIQQHLQTLQPLRKHCEIIVADGGSKDGTIAIAEPLSDQVFTAPKGRARQMNAGADRATGKILLFLHADTFLPDEALSLIQQGLRKGSCWGRFDIHLTGSKPMLKVIARMMNWRSRLTGIATGDQVLFMTRHAYDYTGGFPDIPLMEDIALSIKLKQLGKPLCLKAKVISSGRRWEQFGVIKTILLMWWLRLLYCFGFSPKRLSRLYSGGIFWNL